jgi:hypothetical protein
MNTYKNKNSSLNGLYTLSELPEEKEERNLDSDWFGDLYIGTGLINGQPHYSEDGPTAFLGHVFEISREDFDKLKAACVHIDALETIESADRYYRKRYAGEKRDHIGTLRRWILRAEDKAKAESACMSGYGVEWW